MSTLQIEQWAGEFGREYTDRNALMPHELNALYQKNYGVDRSQINARFLAGIPLDARILEVGCNIGNQLLLLQQMGFRNLYGVEVQHYALQQARRRVKDVCLAEASAYQIPYPDQYFDLVFTSGVLIHIAPEDLRRALAEMVRCTAKYIWGFEYYAAEAAEVNYRGHRQLLWKMDYANLYLRHCKGLKLLRAERFPYIEDSNVDCMFLLQKTRTAESPASA
jgi:pseudaminic acid biosynthesis-associated methylase